MALVQSSIQELSMRLSRASTKIAAKGDLLLKQGAKDQASALYKVADQMGGDYRRFAETGGSELGLVDDLMTGKIGPEQAQRTVKMAMDSMDFRQAVKAANKAGGAAWDADWVNQLNSYSANALGWSIGRVPEKEQLALFQKTAAAAPDNATRTSLAGAATDLVYYGRDEIGPPPSRARVQAFHTEARKLLTQVFSGPATDKEFEDALRQLTRMPGEPEMVPVLQQALNAAGSSYQRVDRVVSASDDVYQLLGMMHPIARRQARAVGSAAGEARATAMEAAQKALYL